MWSLLNQNIVDNSCWGMGKIRDLAPMDGVGILLQPYSPSTHRMLYYREKNKISDK